MSRTIPFTKGHGTGNDFVIVVDPNGRLDLSDDEVAVLCDRHFGIGGDGILRVVRSSAIPDGADMPDAEWFMDYRNADGSKAEMCGNGIRVFARYLHEREGEGFPMRIRTRAGVKVLDRVGEEFTADMGTPEVLGETEVSVMGRSWPALHVSMGNPHAVMFVDDVATIDLEHEGPEVEHHPAFPRRINAHWVQVHNRGEVTMRTWERGSGITLACGTGASAVGVAGVLAGLTDRKVLIHLPGGDLTIEWRESDNHVYMTGPATEVFSGEWNG